MLDILLLGIANMAASTIGGAALKRRSSNVDRMIDEGYDYETITPLETPSILDRFRPKKVEADPKDLLDQLQNLDPATVSQAAIDTAIAKKNSKINTLLKFVAIPERFRKKPKKPVLNKRKAALT